MRLLAVLPLLAVATSDPVVKTWTFPELAFATGNHSGRKTAEEMEYLEDAKYEIAHAYNKNETSEVLILSPSGKSTWTFQELKEQNPNPLSDYFDLTKIKTSEEAREFAKGHAITIAYNELMDSIRKWRPRNAIKVSEPGIDISKWNIKDLKEGLRNPKTHPALKPYLEDAYPALMEYIRSGYRNESIVILTPVGLIPHKQNKLVFKRKRNIIQSSPTKSNIHKFITRHPKGWPVRRS